MNDSHDHAIRSGPSLERRAEYDDTELTGGISGAGWGRPSRSNARSCWGPPSMSATQTVRSSHHEVLDDQATRRHDLVCIRHGCALRQRQPQDPAVRGVASGQQVHDVGAEHGIRAVVGDVRQPPPVAPNPSDSWRRRKICHSPPSPLCTLSISQRPSGDVEKTFSAMSSSATPSGKSSRSAARRGRGTTPAAWNPAGSAMRVYQNPEPSSRQAMEPPMRWTWGMDRRRPCHSRRRRCATSRPRSRAPTARPRDGPVRGRDEPVDRGLADGSMASGSTTMRSVRVSSTSVRATRNGRCRGV